MPVKDTASRTDRLTGSLGAESVLGCAMIQLSTLWGLSTLHGYWVDQVILGEAKQAPHELVPCVLCIWAPQASGDYVPKSLVLATVTLIPTIRMAPQGNQNLRAWGRVDKAHHPVLETQVYSGEHQVPMLLSECGTVSITLLGLPQSVHQSHPHSSHPTSGTSRAATARSPHMGYAHPICRIADWPPERRMPVRLSWATALVPPTLSCCLTRARVLQGPCGASHHRQGQ